MRAYSKERIISADHWTDKFYVQRISQKEWRQVLLNNDDSLIYNGRITKLVGKSIGFGVVEVSKKLEN